MNGSTEQKRVEAQRRSDLPNGVVFSKVKGVVEMHTLDKVELHIDDTKLGVKFDGTVGEFVKSVLQDIAKKTNDLKLHKEAILSINERLEHLEKVVKDYGLE